ncbi:hypothetical protein [Maridesulfovibrio sp.]|uniref:hypothetical protein n=1 Tax=Maridesulfovibrio sp. TaxID=2795000 RepID=UPI0029C9C73A|nr:hypothetical protein [Maridesulfovibrio sp.]
MNNMNQTEISEKIKAIAESAGLNEEEMQVFLSGNGDIPDALQEVLDRLGDDVSRQCLEE